MAHRQLMYKNPEVDLRNRYPKWFELSVIIALLVTIGIFYVFKRFESGVVLEEVVDREIQAEVIPPTQQIQKPPPPARPKIPVEAEDEDVPEDLEIDEELFDFEQETTELPPPPPEEEEPIVPFYALSDKPVEIKRVNPVYPELAKKAGIEGVVVVKALVNTKGDVEKVEILKSHPLLDEAAVTAAKQFKFKPGKQRDKLVKVWMSIPFNFRLK
ncbi:MAG TPA: energy transducer TonB [Calditrichia bacterium]|nr:energy transducer TonB [Calditrichota bacterium]HQU73114.1 energy transducer TonB [Calditrichia bacterium]HQV31827.1 energy transducer TonB [Calditrichia bacterium]